MGAPVLPYSPWADDPDGFDPASDGEQPFVLEPPRPINWDLLSAEDLQAELKALDSWVDWLRRTYGLPATVIPPFWHRHPELLWELSALHLHWLTAYHPDQHASAPHGWHRDLHDTFQRLRDWTAGSGTRIDRDRPTRQTLWPGEHPDPDLHTAERPIADRHDDFTQFVIDQVTRRGRAGSRVASTDGRS